MALFLLSGVPSRYCAAWLAAGEGPAQRCMASLCVLVSTTRVQLLRPAFGNHFAASLTMPEDIRSKLLYVKQWPDFSLEDDVSRIGDVARICALLSRKPTVGFLIHRSVDLPSYDVEPLLKQLVEQGCVAVFQAGFEPLAVTAGEEGEGAQTLASASAQGSPSGSFLTRLWNKLIAK